MAMHAVIGGGGTLFKGEDKSIRLEVLGAGDIPEDISGWTIVLDIRTAVDAGSATLSESATISGTYNANRNTNTQRAVFTIEDTELTFTGTYFHVCKRTDAGSETILAFGPFIVEDPTLD